MQDILLSGGWVMLPIGICSILVVSISIDRLIQLRRGRVIPKGLLDRIAEALRDNTLDQAQLERLAADSHMGQILHAGLLNRQHDRDIIREAIEDQGRFVHHQLSRNLGLLGTIGMVTPVLGLLGTVLGMIEVFEAVSVHGLGDPLVLASGISAALVSTAAGLIVALPAVALHHYFSSRVRHYVITMEQEAIKLIEIISGEREPDALTHDESLA